MGMLILKVFMCILCTKSVNNTHKYAKLLLCFCFLLLVPFGSLLTGNYLECTEFAFLWLICCTIPSRFVQMPNWLILEGNLRIIRLHLHENRVKWEVNLPNFVVHFWPKSLYNHISRSARLWNFKVGGS